MDSNKLETVKSRRLAIFGRSALEAAGFRKADLRSALAATRRNLEAKKKVRVVTGSGDDKELLTFEEDNGAVQLRAAEQIYRLADVLPRTGIDKDLENNRVPFVVEVVQENLDGTRTAVRVSGTPNPS